MLISNRYEYGVDDTTTSKKKLTKARGHRSLCLTIPCMKQDADGMPRDKDKHTRIRTRLCLHSLTGVGVDIQSEGTDMTINRLHSARYANSSLFGSVTHMLSREILVFALCLDGDHVTNFDALDGKEHSFESPTPLVLACAIRNDQHRSW